MLPPIALSVAAAAGLLVALGAVLWTCRPVVAPSGGRLAPHYVSLAAVAHLAQADIDLIEGFYAHAGARVAPNAAGRMFIHADDAFNLSDELLRHIATRRNITQ